MLMLLCVHVTRVLFLVLAGNFALTMYGLLLELHTLTLVARSYALLLIIMRIPYQQLKENEILATKLSYLISVLLRCKLSGVGSTLNDLVP